MRDPGGRTGRRGSAEERPASATDSDLCGVQLDSRRCRFSLKANRSLSPLGEKTKENASRCFRPPPPEELGRANNKTCDVTQGSQKERGKGHIKAVKLDPPLSESDRSGFLIDGFDMAFAMFFREHLQTKKQIYG